MNNEYLKEQLQKFDDKTTIKDLQKYINDMVEIRGFQDTPQDLMLLLTEEIGELAKEIRKSRKYFLDVNKNNELDVEGEIADVFIYLLSICRVMNVNLIDAFKDKEERNCKENGNKIETPEMQTLSALFHDIATPSFKHCIDFLNGDYEKQESTEDLTAGNDSKLKQITRLLDYGNIKILKNEEGIDELGFKDKEVAEKFIEQSRLLWPEWCNNRFKITGQFLLPNVKKRYINPLVNSDGNNDRLYNVSNIAKQQIDEFLNFKTKKYAYFDFNF